MTAEELAKLFVEHRFRFKDEKELQAGIYQVLAKQEEILFIPEYALSPGDRIDFFVLGDGIGIEVKTDDSKGGAGLSVVTRQLWRYAKSDDVKALILVTTRFKHRSLPSEILGKPLFVVYLNSFL